MKEKVSNLLKTNKYVRTALFVIVVLSLYHILLA